VSDIGDGVRGGVSAEQGHHDEGEGMKAEGGSEVAAQGSEGGAGHAASRARDMEHQGHRAERDSEPDGGAQAEGHEDDDSEAL